VLCALFRKKNFANIYRPTSKTRISVTPISCFVGGLLVTKHIFYIRNSDMKYLLYNYSDMLTIKFRVTELGCLLTFTIDKFIIGLIVFHLLILTAVPCCNVLLSSAGLLGH
jgi:hypothetical protein